MTRKRAALTGPDVGDQTRLRRVAPLRSIDDFVSFLTELEELFGPIERTREPTTGEHFEL